MSGSGGSGCLRAFLIVATVGVLGVLAFCGVTLYFASTLKHPTTEASGGKTAAASHPPEVAQPVRTRNAGHESLVALSEPQRRTMLERVLAGAGTRCKATRTFFQGMSSRGEAIWNVRCASGPDMSVMIRPDAGGSTQVLECSTLLAVTKVECFRRYESK